MPLESLPDLDAGLWYSMLFSVVSALAFWPLQGVLGRVGQFPVVNGVIGGVPNTVLPLQEAQAVSPAATTPGKLRVTENSGVCGENDFCYICSNSLKKHSQKPPPAYIKLLDTVI